MSALHCLPKNVCAHVGLNVIGHSPPGLPPLAPEDPELRLRMKPRLFWKPFPTSPQRAHSRWCPGTDSAEMGVTWRRGVQFTQVGTQTEGRVAGAFPGADAELSLRDEQGWGAGHPLRR